MLRVAFLSLFIMVLVGSGHAGTAISEAESSELATALAAEMSGFRLLAEEALTLRAETIKVGKRILADQQAGAVLTGADLALLNEGLADQRQFNLPFGDN